VERKGELTFHPGRNIKILTRVGLMLHRLDKRVLCGVAYPVKMDSTRKHAHEISNIPTKPCLILETYIRYSKHPVMYEGKLSLNQNGQNT
jgi:hypothetical protein